VICIGVVSVPLPFPFDERKMSSVHKGEDDLHQYRIGDVGFLHRVVMTASLSKSECPVGERKEGFAEAQLAAKNSESEAHHVMEGRVSKFKRQ
jgi:hypothetical protein